MLHAPSRYHTTGSVLVGGGEPETLVFRTDAPLRSFRPVVESCASTEPSLAGLSGWSRASSPGQGLTWRIESPFCVKLNVPAYTEPCKVYGRFELPANFDTGGDIYRKAGSPVLKEYTLAAEDTCKLPKNTRALCVKVDQSWGLAGMTAAARESRKVWYTCPLSKVESDSDGTRVKSIEGLEYAYLTFTISREEACAAVDDGRLGWELKLQFNVFLFSEEKEREWQRAIASVSALDGESNSLGELWRRP
ncbi:MAG: hypothetical protein Kow00107_10410 [Planctomycetota bacterium]